MENKLQPKDLRIGNFVEYNGMYLPVSSIKSPKPLKDERYADKWLIELFGGASWIDCTIDDIKPIPLTQEWLLKFSFKRETEDDKYGRVWLHKSFGNFFLRRVNFNNPILEKPDYGYALEISDDNNWITIYKRVDSVNQLQILFFALTGEELTIK